MAEIALGTDGGLCSPCGIYGEDRTCVFAPMLFHNGLLKSLRADGHLVRNSLSPPLDGGNVLKRAAFFVVLQELGKGHWRRRMSWQGDPWVTSWE